MGASWEPLGSLLEPFGSLLEAFRSPVGTKTAGLVETREKNDRFWGPEMTPNRPQIAQEASKLLPNLRLNLAWNSTSNFHFSSHLLADVRLNRESGDMRFVS